MKQLLAVLGIAAALSGHCLGTALAQGVVFPADKSQVSLPPYGNGAAGVGMPPSSQYPKGAVAIGGNGTGSTGAVVGTLTPAATDTAYICGFNVSALGTLTVGPITVAGLLGGSQVYQLVATAGGVTLEIQFSPCIPASAINTPITTTTTADASATAVDVNSWGY